MAKITPYPPCTGTVIWLACRREPGQLPDAASGNTTSPYCRAVSGNNSAVTLWLWASSVLFVFCLWIAPFLLPGWLNYKCLTGLPLPACLHMAIHGFVFLDNIQNRSMSTICQAWPSLKPVFVYIDRLINSILQPLTRPINCICLSHFLHRPYITMYDLKLL